MPDPATTEVTDASTLEYLRQAFHFQLIYWLLFIYLSLTVMDEMIELFSVINQLEKGALGLFFEMNYFVGVALAGYIMWFVRKFPSVKHAEKADGQPDDVLQAKFDHMQNWLFFQYIYIYLSVFISITVYILYSNMNKKASKKIRGPDVEKPNYADLEN